MISIEQIVSYLDEAIAQSTLRGDTAELRQIQQVTVFLAQVAEQQGDRARAAHLRRVGTIAGDAAKRVSSANEGPGA